MKQWAAQSAGGKAKAAMIRAEYANSPNICLQCDLPITPKPGEKLTWVKIRKFCSRRCSVSYHHKAGIYANRSRMVRKCSECVKETQYEMKRSAARKYCRSCWMSKLMAFENKTKAEVPRRSLAAHARVICQALEKVCFVCGYRNHVEVCHRKAVKDFAADSKIAEINAQANLVLLCPNHHWEFDRGRLSL